ncbi:hypothetical protein [Streptomyces sp. NPDC005438]|uniref:hypothetical protein n=1 Tax=Streptomyces sp. NPDC005438 TaxID=3156880 RepID=UPI0033A6BF29
MTGDDRFVMPPVRLPDAAVLAEEARATPLLSRAVRLTRWAKAGVRVGAGGELSDSRLAEAVTELSLEGEPHAEALVSDAWNFAVDVGLLEVEEDPGAEGTEAAGVGDDEESGTATPVPNLDELIASPEELLEAWGRGTEAVVAEATLPSLEELIGDVDQLVAENGEIDPSSLDLDRFDWDEEEAANTLTSALGNLYLMVATEAVATDSMVPLPVVAASLVIPEDMDEPTDEVLGEVSETMIMLDGWFRSIEPTGLIAYRPVDDALTEDADGGAVPLDEEEDVSQYGMVRLTPLGVYLVRERLREEGADAPLVGELAEVDARRLLATLPWHGDLAAREEIAGWLSGREPVAAARELLEAARGADPEAPARRLACQQTLSLMDAEAEPALRAVLDDRELGGLARVWLTEVGVGQVPPPDEEMVFWLTVDTLAAQLRINSDPSELQELVGGLLEQHTGFFDAVWRTGHPATADVLEGVAELLPDKEAAKEARRAAYRARSQ